MENAAKALLIAGGILLMILTLSLLVYMTGSIEKIEQAQNQKKQVEELARFNLEYEAYNKQRLYGVDVITVINKAIANNKKMDVLDKSDEKYYINIEFKLEEALKNGLYYSEEKLYGDGEKEEEYCDIDDNDFDTKFSKIPDELKERFTITYEESGEIKQIELIDLLSEESEFKDKKSYILGDFVGDSFITNDSFTRLFKGRAVDTSETIVKNGIKETCILYSALTNFKRAIFKCEDMHYNPDTGRIDSITFEQIKTNDNIYYN